MKQLSIFLIAAVLIAGMAGCAGGESYALAISSTEGGSVTVPGEGIFAYDEGTVVNLTAEAEEGYRFVEWTGDVGSIANVEAASTNITMSASCVITAIFIAIYDLTISSTTGGSVTSPGEGAFASDEGTVVNLLAEAEEGYLFFEWTGDADTIANVYAASTIITMNGDYSITANFVAIYDLTISSTIGGSVTTPGEGVYTYGELSVFGLLAEAEEGYRFVEWTGDVDKISDVGAAITTITMYDNYEITANFEEDSPFPSPTGGCFIATAAYGTPAAEQIDVLPKFRDTVLLESTAGSLFVALYYQLSPPVADFIAGNELLRTLVREFLIDPIVWVVEATGEIWRN